MQATISMLERGGQAAANIRAASARLAVDAFAADMTSQAEVRRLALADPTTLVISAAQGPEQAHNPHGAESALYRRSGNRPWHQVQDGFPEPHGLLIAVLATHEAEPGVFYAANNKGVFRSADARSSWEALPIRWPEGLHIGRANALMVAPE